MRMQSTALDTLLLNAAESFEPLAAAKHIRQIITLPEESLPDCICDADRIRQLLVILLDNALSYTPSGGTVRITLSFDARFHLTVSDNGPGIPDHEKQAVFDRFFRADASRSDHTHYGLGLSIALQIVKAHHGTITVSDAEGGGACFAVTLP